MHRIAKIACALSLMACAGQASASLIVEEDSLIDTGNGLEWLFLNQTTNASYNDIVRRVSEGYYSDYKIATYEEFWLLLDASGGDGVYTDDTAGSVTFDVLAPQWGVGSDHYSSATSLWFHLADVTDGGLTSGANLSQNGKYNQYANGFSSPSTIYPYIGTVLVRNASIQNVTPEVVDVSEPFTLGLFGLGLMGLGLRRFKK